MLYAERETRVFSKAKLSAFMLCFVILDIQHLKCNQINGKQGGFTIKF